MTALTNGALQYGLTQEQEDLRDMIRGMVAARVAPRAADFDASGEFPEDIRQCSPSTMSSACRSRSVTAGRERERS
jgi:alkylation response protein AidB-like acyl-CoA dehydrogenase